MSSRPPTLPPSDESSAKVLAASTVQVRRVVDAGTVIFDEGAPSGSAFVVESGGVEIFRERDGLEVSIATLGPGELFGEIALLDGGVRTASVRATERTVLLELDHATMRRYVEGADSVVALVMGILVSRVRSMVGPGGHLTPLPKPSLGDPDVFGRIRAEREIAQAIGRQEFVPALQPVVNLADGSVVGFEALARWEHPERGVVMPASFIPQAEAAKLVGHIDWILMKRACEVLQRLRGRLGPSADRWWVSANLSATHFSKPTTAPQVKAILRETGLPASALKVEITETAFLEDIDAAARVAGALRELGCQVALDDFGVGYASLGYLQQMPLDSLKIDRVFIDRLYESDRSAAIVKAMLGLGESFSLTTVAEGVERDEQARRLRDLGCGYAQGWHFARPMLEDALWVWLSERGLP